MRSAAIFALVVLLFSIPQHASAGEVFKRKCPNSCASLGIPKSHCKDWKEKNKCVVEVMPGANAGGKTTLTKKCPLSCSSLQVPKNRCKDWKEGDKCSVKL